MSPNSNATFQDLSNSMAEAVKRAAPSVVTVDARRRIPASGIMVSDALVLTADHAVESQEDIHVVFQDGNRVSASFAGHDPGSDLALLQINPPKGTPAQFTEKEPAVGEIVLALGRPTSGGIQASLGVISTIAGPLRSAHGGILDSYLRTDAIPYPGFSGGPLVNASGEVIGINTSGLVRGMSIVIPNMYIHKVVELLKSHGKVPRGYLGIRSQPTSLPESQRQQLERSQKSGLLLVSIEEQSPAARGGLMVGDILVGLNQQPIADPQDLFANLAGLNVGSEIPVEILRGGQLQTISVIIGERE